MWGGEAWRNWQLATSPGRGQKSKASEQRRPVCACLSSASILSRFNSMRDTLSSHPLYPQGGRSGTDCHLGEGRCLRRLVDGENSAHVFCPGRSSCISTAFSIPSPATLSTLHGGADPGRIFTVGSSGNRFVQPLCISNIEPCPST